MLLLILCKLSTFAANDTVITVTGCLKTGAQHKIPQTAEGRLRS